MSKLTLEIDEDTLIDFIDSVLEGLEKFYFNKIVFDKDNKKLIVILRDDKDEVMEWETR